MVDSEYNLSIQHEKLTTMWESSSEQVNIRMILTNLANCYL